MDGGGDDETKTDRHAADDRLASRVVCKSWERVTGPMFVHAIKDAVEDTFTTAAGGKGAHGADTPA
ncbi:MAG TPA: hypothetical protein VNZ64_06735, partial [Candidatus Acidoferrum sp.]|nr:hypothetical protein [Candidatus Acidoferrum sp.]